MRRQMLAAAAAALALGAAAPAWTQEPPAAIAADPAPDPAHPPRLVALGIPSGGVLMNGLFYLAGGPGPHPTLVLFHGFPGNEQNLDLAQAVRRAGWNVLTLHYRGSWGSPGAFSMRHVIEDAKAAEAFVSAPDVAAKYGIDRRRIVLAGHSMGGFAAASAARDDHAIAGLALLDAWNVGADAARLAAIRPADRHGVAKDQFGDSVGPLAGVTANGFADELAGHAQAWDVLGWAPQLTAAPVLVVGADQAFGARNHAIAEAIARAGGRVTEVSLPTDHYFSDRRIALQAAVIRWLEALPR
jgi:pimeloyl-ACP methyl ester carboxylesterase